MKLVLDEWIVREVIDTLYMSRNTFLGITGLDSPQEVAKRTSENETAITCRISKAIDIIQQSEQPQEEKKLPEGLEEAAWDCVLDSVDVNNPVLLPKYKELLTYLFIAGAEWMAGQGESVEIYVNEEDGYDFHYDLGRVIGTLDLQNLGLYKKGGVNQDDLIIQIRKK